MPSLKAMMMGPTALGLGLGLGLAGPALAEAPRFTSVQPETLGVVGSISNAWADFDQDGDLDLAVSLKGGEVRLYRNDGGQLVNIGAAVGLPTSGIEIRGLSWGDYDGDGYPDLLGGSNEMVDRSTNQSFVWRNRAGQGFDEVSAQIGLTIPGRISRQANWIDYDNDGQLDLYAADRAGPNRLYRQVAGAFQPAFGEGGVNDGRATVGACWFDYDRDGDLDLYLANQSGSTDALWRNDGDSFTDVAPELGLDQAGRDRSVGGVGCAVGDYDNDGHLDLFVAVYGTDLLYRNKGDGTFEEVAAKAGVAHAGHAVGAAWGDYDNDGWLDLFVTHYEGPSGQQVPVNFLYHNKGDGSFEQVLTREHLLNAGDHGVEWVDYDADGLIDLSLTDGYGSEGGHFVFRNGLEGPRRDHHLVVQPLGREGRPALPGTEVRLYDAAGQVLATRMVSTGGGYNAQSLTPLHFGLRTLDPVTVEIRYPGGRTVRQEAVDPADHRAKVFKLGPQF
jgi:hypothetical protein